MRSRGPRAEITIDDSQSTPYLRSSATADRVGALDGRPSRPSQHLLLEADMSPAPGRSRAPAYRPDIDGLRALAVIAVVLFHSGIPGFDGGYVGVDVFCVISGYLITQLLQESRDESARRTLAPFSVRCMMRLLPACLPPCLVPALAPLALYTPVDLVYLRE